MTSPAFDPTRPAELSASRVWELLSHAIEQGSGLLPLDGDPFSTEPPSSAMHRRFRIEPSAERTPGTYGGRQRYDEREYGDDYEGDLLEKTLPLVVTLYHDYDPGQHSDSYRLASDDVELVEDALLTHPAALRTQAVLETHSVTRRSHTLVSTITLTTIYERQLPPIRE